MAKSTSTSIVAGPPSSSSGDDDKKKSSALSRKTSSTPSAGARPPPARAVVHPNSMNLLRQALASAMDNSNRQKQKNIDRLRRRQDDVPYHEKYRGHSKSGSLQLKERRSRPSSPPPAPTRNSSFKHIHKDGSLNSQRIQNRGVQQRQLLDEEHKRAIEEADVTSSLKRKAAQFSDSRSSLVVVASSSSSKIRHKIRRYGSPGREDEDGHLKTDKDDTGRADSDDSDGKTELSDSKISNSYRGGNVDGDSLSGGKSQDPLAALEENALRSRAKPKHFRNNQQSIELDEFGRARPTLTNNTPENEHFQNNFNYRHHKNDSADETHLRYNAGKVYPHSPHGNYHDRHRHPHRGSVDEYNRRNRHCGKDEEILPKSYQLQQIAEEARRRRIDELWKQREEREWESRD